MCLPRLLLCIITAAAMIAIAMTATTDAKITVAACVNHDGSSNLEPLSPTP